MSNPTSNFGWVMPTSTDLVTDLPADFEVFGQGVDTSMAQLKGGTTGQILSKTSATDMAFTWVTPNPGDITAVNVTSPITGGGTSGDVTIGIQAGSTTQSGALQLTDSTASTSTTTAATPNSVKTSYDLANAAIPKSTVTTAGDLILASGASTVSRLGIGANGTVLSSNGTTASWQTPTATASTLSQISTGTFSGSSLTFSSLTLDTYIFMSKTSTFDLSAASNPKFRMKLNSIATGYRYASMYTNGTSAEPQNSYTAAGTIWQSVLNMNSGFGAGEFWFKLENCKATGYTRYEWDMRYYVSGGSTVAHDWGRGVVETNAQLTSLTFDISAGTWSNGDYVLYGA